MNFFLLRDGSQHGPYPLSSLPKMRSAGDVLSTDQIWVEGAPGWVRVGDYESPATAAGPPPLPQAVLAGGPAPPPLPVSAPGADGATAKLIADVEAGGRFVLFPYCISVLILTFKRSSKVLFLRRDQDGAGEAIRYSLLSGLLGWWGIPWGPIWTIAALITNARGGKDVTREVLTDAVGPTAAASILARRRKPEPAGLLMNAFRVALIGVPLLLCAAVLFLPFAMDKTEPEPATPGEAAFEAANRAIAVNRGDTAFGNSDQAIAVAREFSRAMKVFRGAAFTGGKPSGYSASKHEFLSYCDLRPSQCIILVHVPELRRFKAEAKDFLCAQAWAQAQAAVRTRKAGQPGMKIVVGVRGMALYDRVMTGQFTDSTDASNGPADAVKGMDSKEILQMSFEEALKSTGAGTSRH